ncbi:MULTISPECIES: DUF423 domain-containing protein [Corallincola]|uniref:DUF423 domain-containing protein n=3 Tax=Corallincola TaxID=1775176 RepID=A0A368NGK7_9GAMM|nr:MULTISPECIES: DUF423 domain-containing protein [Corallincola]RCU48845.1 DUF423 domain-containing protein [Corallincola holothuriorum]TAA43739.1 DUF423 domain-containing protein [Corallincola spongiicola]TCI02986.1 DUF423 domain-containing protein [Corallincola luteus]
MKKIATIAALMMATGIALGAFGAHGLKHRLSPELMAAFNTGVQYQIYHGLGVLALVALSLYSKVSLRSEAIWLILGATLFSGSLYLLAVSGIGVIGMITPIGGSALILGWLLAAKKLWQEMS